MTRQEAIVSVVRIFAGVATVYDENVTIKNEILNTGADVLLAFGVTEQESADALRVLAKQHGEKQ